MELFLNLLPVEVASAAAVNSAFFSTLTAGANMVVSIIKWAALLWILVKVSMLGFSIATQAKSSADAFKKIKEEGLALFIGLFIVMTAFMIHGALKDTVNSIGQTGNNNSTSVDYVTDDVFN